MRIHKIHIENIASLKGKHQIDFDSISDQSNLFAITGKTGAGKSSILNSISLALYGEVYKKGAQHLDFVTLGEAEGQIELFFSAAGSFYKAFWKLKIKKKNGEPLKKPQSARTLFILKDGEYEAIDKNIASLINLSFNQFCKTSILNQGEFAKFLTSSFTERKSILEKFYEGENLEFLNQKLREKIKETNLKIQEKQNTIEGLKESFADIDFDPKVLQTKSSEVSLFKAFDTIIKKVFSESNDFIKNQNLIETNIQRADSANHGIIDTQAKLNVLLADYNKKSEIHKATEENFNNRKPILNECIKLFIEQKNFEDQETKKAGIKKEQEEQVASFQKNMNTLQAELKSFDEKIKIVQEKESRIIFDTFEKQDLEKRFQEISLLEVNLIQLRKELIQLQGQEENLKSKLKSIQIEIDNNNKKLQINDLEKFKSDLQIKKELTNQLKRIQDQFTNSKIRHLALEKDLETTNTKVKAEGLKLSNLELEGKEIEESVLVAENAKKFFQINEAINLCLDHSKESGECVVCHSKDLTQVTEAKSIDDQEYLKACAFLEKQQIKLEENKNKQNELRLTLMGLKKSALDSKERLESINSEVLMAINKVDSELSKSFKQTKTKSIFTDQNIDNLNERLAKILKETEKNDTSLLEHQMAATNNELLTKQLNEAKKDLEHILDRKSSTENTGLGKANELKEILDFLNLSNTFLDKKTPEILKKLNEIKAHYLEYKKVSENHDNHLNEINSLKVRLDAAKNALLSITDEIKELKDNIIKRKQALKEKGTTNPQEELKILEVDFSKSNELLRQLEKNKKEFEIILAEQKSKLHHFQEQVKALVLNSETCKHNISEALASLKNLNPELASFSLYGPLVGLAKAFQDSQGLDFNSKPDNYLNLLNESKIKFEAELKSLNQLISETNNEVTRLQTIQNRQQENEKKIKQYNEQMKGVQEKLNQLEDLNLLIGKDEFRNYVLSIIENLLIDQTNYELKTLCQGRYGIKQTNKTNRMASEFKIVDYFRDAKERKVSTLSGGETFLVSLAMALALAELTRGKTQLDSLFIDEGFGTLDSDAVDEVLELLISMQHSGKQIGIISHVKGLTSRIPVNINLLKNHDGLSNIEILYN